jgi:serine/threonine protein kinase
MAEGKRPASPKPGIAQRIGKEEPLMNSEVHQDHFASEPSSPSVESQDNFSNFLDPKSVTIPENFKFRQGCKLGEGSYAKVYRARYEGSSCAVKIFKEGALKSEVHQKGLDKKDIMSTCTLKHPNIVHIYGLWNDPHKGRDALAIVMELCDCSLHEYIKGHKAKGIPKETKLKILHDITNGMIYLHKDKGMVHGDLRSCNVLLLNTKPSGNSADEQPLVAKLADFDLTRCIDPKSRVHYTTNFANEDFLPPEVFDEGNTKDRKQARLTFSVDVFCFGPLAIELACMEYPKPTAQVVQKKRNM